MFECACRSIAGDLQAIGARVLSDGGKGQCLLIRCHLHVHGRNHQGEGRPCMRNRDISYFPVMHSYLSAHVLQRLPCTHQRPLELEKGFQRDCRAVVKRMIPLSMFVFCLSMLLLYRAGECTAAAYHEGARE